VLGTEWGEYAEEHYGPAPLPAARRPAAARPGRYIEQFGAANYDIALGDCRWHIYRMIGKLSGRIYLLSARNPSDCSYLATYRCSASMPAWVESVA